MSRPLGRLPGMARGMGMFLVLLALLVLGCRADDAVYGPDSPVRVLSDAQFEREVVGTRNVTLVAFFTSSCEHCKDLVPEFERVARHLAGIVPVVAVDVNAYPAVARQFGVTQLPYIAIFPAARGVNPYTGAGLKTPTEHTGDRTAKAMAAAATEALAATPDAGVAVVSSADGTWDVFLAAGSSPDLPRARVLLLTHKGRTAAVVHALSLQFGQRLAFARGSATDVPLTAAAGLEGAIEVGAPAAVVVFPAEGGAPVAYPGDDLSASALSSFLTPYAGEEETSADPAGGGGHPPARDRHDDPPHDQLPTIPAADFASVVLAAEDVYIIALLGDPTPGDEEDCALRRAALVTAAIGTQGAVPHMATVNITAAAQAAAGESAAVVASLRSRYPPGDDDARCLQVLSFPFGLSKEDSDPAVFHGPMNAATLREFALDAVPDLVVRVTSASLDGFASRTSADTPKVLLFSAKSPDCPSVYKALAALFRDTMVFGLAPADDARLIDRFHVKAIPTVIALFAKAGSSPSPGQSTELEVAQFTGAMKFPNLLRFLRQIGEYTGRPNPRLLSPADAAARARAAQMPPPPPVPVVSIDTDASWRSVCDPTSSSLCVVALVDGRDGSAMDHVRTLGEAAALAARGAALLSAAGGAVPTAPHVASLFTYVWVDAPRQPGFAAALGVSLSDLPAVMVISPKRQRVARFGEGYRPDAIARWLASIVTGKAPTRVLQDMPRVVDGGEDAAGDGDGAAAADEFSLDDVLGTPVGDAGGDILLSKEERLKRAEAEIAAEAAEAAAAAESTRVAAAAKAKADARLKAQAVAAAKKKKAAARAAAGAGGDL